jgi:creatinine amidohydrolase
MSDIAAPDVDPDLAGRLGGSGRPVRWELLTAQETAEVVARTPAAIIPAGATEQHGPHLPTGVDSDICRHVALGVSALTGVPVLPALTYGVSASHGRFPGSVGIRPETMIAMVEDITDDLYARGVRDFVLLNGHTWNHGALDVSAEKLRTRYDDARVRALAYVTMYPGPEIVGHAEHGRGLLHAGYFEMAIMMHLRPELVDRERIVSQQDRPSFWDYRLDQASPSGVWGRRVDEATPEHGAAELRRCIETTAEAVAAAIAEPWPDVSG